jgi:hypothetical protein
MGDRAEWVAELKELEEEGSVEPTIDDIMVAPLGRFRMAKER